MKNQVREIRKEQRISQKELAEKAFVTRQTLSLIEKGEYNPTLKLCLAICYVLNKKLDEVFWIEESELTDEKI
ncbi:helix-turn-helix transcriptional regulator [Desemzia sp. RIT804]|uniref:helix-turn-helix transcriptional regulator n=1 Tax=Desemzia sp. RIT 804 TaxID=2810209 RepID=UPI0019520649|nr:helix-turn-helix transcriptional regulator [Desemzia sp. RIT 804]MBM6613837.1 helix-turn-helix transcriptional regulator [Desemzia sp. RIT 804]